MIELYEEPTEVEEPQPYIIYEERWQTWVSTTGSHTAHPFNAKTFTADEVAILCRQPGLRADLIVDIVLPLVDPMRRRLNRLEEMVAKSGGLESPEVLAKREIDEAFFRAMEGANHG